MRGEPSSALFLLKCAQHTVGAHKILVVLEMQTNASSSFPTSEPDDVIDDYLHIAGFLS